jgi:DNA-binding transcriptional LysR family regulator
MIDLAALSALRAVSDEGSVIGAARALGFTPSAVSQQVKRLERQAGLPLLERVGRGVLLTDAGRQLVEDGSHLLADLERIRAELHRTADTVAGHVRLTAFSTAMRGLVAPAVRRLLDDHADLRITLEEREPWDTVDLVATGHSDVGVVHSWGDQPVLVPDNVQAETIAHDEADVLLPRDHPLAGSTRLATIDLVGEPWIATPAGTICRAWLDRMYVGTERVPRIAHVAMEFDSHLAMVRARLGIALVPRMGRQPLGPDLVAVEARQPVPTREIVALHRRSMADSPAVRAVVGALLQSPAQRRTRSPNKRS